MLTRFLVTSQDKHSRVKRLSMQKVPMMLHSTVLYVMHVKALNMQTPLLSLYPLVGPA